MTKALHAYVSEEAHDTFRRFAGEQEITVTALLEAMAEQFREMQERGEDLPRDLVRQARHIDAARRRRGRSKAV